MTRSSVALLAGICQLALAGSACRSGAEHARLVPPASVARSVAESPSRTPVAPPTPAHPAEPVHTSASGSDERSFSSPYGSSFLNSHVLVSRRRIGQLNPAAITMRDPNASSLRAMPPFALVVSPNGRHGVLASRSQVDILDDEGSRLALRSRDATAFDDLVVLAGDRVNWDGGHSPGNSAFINRRLFVALTPSGSAACGEASRKPAAEDCRPSLACWAGPACRTSTRHG